MITENDFDYDHTFYGKWKYLNKKKCWSFISQFTGLKLCEVPYSEFNNSFSPFKTWVINKNVTDVTTVYVTPEKGLPLKLPEPEEKGENLLGLNDNKAKYEYMSQLFRKYCDHIKKKGTYWSNYYKVRYIRENNDFLKFLLKEQDLLVELLKEGTYFMYELGGRMFTRHLHYYSYEECKSLYRKFSGAYEGLSTDPSSPDSYRIRQIDYFKSHFLTYLRNRIKEEKKKQVEVISQNS